METYSSVKLVKREVISRELDGMERRHTFKYRFEPSQVMLVYKCYKQGTHFKQDTLLARGRRKGGSKSNSTMDYMHWVQQSRHGVK